MFNNLRAHQGGYPNPTVAAKFAQPANDFTTLLTTTSMPSGGSVSRSGQAMVYDSTGKLTYAPNNLALYSQDLTNWTADGANVTSSTETAPDGSATATLLTAASGNYRRYRVTTFTVGIAYIYSVYVKQGTAATVQTDVVNQVAGPIFTFATQTYVGGVGVSNHTVTNVGNGWFRLSFKLTPSAASIGPGIAMNGATVGQTVYAWGQQAEAVTYQTTPSTYVATTTAAYYGPRFDYDPSTLAAKGLLIEGTRTNLINYSEQLDNAFWSKTGSTITINNTTSPDGTSSADKVVEDTSTGIHAVGNVCASTPTNIHSASFFAKAAERTFISVQIDNGATAGAYGVVNLTTGAVTSISGTGNPAFNVVSVGNGWWKISVVCIPATSGTTVRLLIYFNNGSVVNYTGNGTSGAYIWGAQIEQASFPSSYIPTVTSTARAAETFTITGYTNRLLEAYYIDQQTNVSSSLPETVVSSGAVTISPPTFGWVTSLRAYTNAYAGSIASPSWLSFSRSGNAMMTDSTGTLTWAPANLQVYSQDYTNAAWTKVRLTATANSSTAPDGTSTANLLDDGTAAGTHDFERALSIVTGQQYVVSIYAKDITRRYLNISITSATTSYSSAVFDLQSATVGSSQAAGTGYTIGNATIVSVGSGWYRCSFVFTSGSATPAISICTANGTTVGNYGIVSYTGGNLQLYAWGCQLEPVTYSTTPSAYIPTTTAAVYGPRYDYDASTVPATPRGLLIEESRSNLLTYSEQFDNAAWTKDGLLAFGSGSTINAAISPDGTQNADLITENTTASNHRVYRNPSLTAGASYSYSFYVKQANGNRNIYVILQNASDQLWLSLNLTTGALIDSGAGGTGTLSSATSTSVGNGWYLVKLCGVISTTQTSIFIQVALKNNTTTGSTLPNYTGDGTSGIFIWGAQLEAGAFATSYIPTTTASVTRAADVAQLTGSALTVAGAATGTAIVQMAALPDTSAVRYQIATSFSRRIVATNNASTVSMYDGTNAATATIPSGTFSTLPFRVASGWASPGASIVVNNGTLVSNTAVNVGTSATVYLGGINTGTAGGQWFASLALYNTRLPDAILKQKSAINAPY